MSGSASNEFTWLDFERIVLGQHNDNMKGTLLMLTIFSCVAFVMIPIVPLMSRLCVVVVGFGLCLSSSLSDKIKENNIFLNNSRLSKDLILREINKMIQNRPLTKDDHIIIISTAKQLVVTLATDTNVNTQAYIDAQA